MRTRIKICGITRSADAQAAVQAGADAIGLIFYPKSARAVDIDVAAEISSDLPALVGVVAVFVNSDSRDIEKVLSKVAISLIQFHGNESAKDCERFGVPYIKAVSMEEDVDPQEIAEAHPNARALLLDSHHKTKYGGTGEPFRWERTRECRTKPVILAGGLAPTNVSEAIIVTRAYGIDVSTGVEITPGIKDPQKIRDLIAVVRGCDQILLGGSDVNRQII
jgi:phosphoribosylanthranilate isomerase